MNNKIVEALLVDNNFKEAFNKICPDKKWKDELLQELCLILLEYDSVKLQKIHLKGDIVYFSIKILKNQYWSNTSPFWKKFRKSSGLEMDDNFDYLDDSDLEVIDRGDEIIKLRVNEMLNKIFWKDAHLFKMYYFGYWCDKKNEIVFPSTRDLEKLHSLGILKMDHTSIFLSIRRTMLYILQNLLSEGLITKKEIDKKWRKLF